MLWPYMCHQQICPLNVTCSYYFMCRYETNVSVYTLKMNSMQSTMWPQTLVYIHFILLENVPQQICLSHHTCLTELIMYSLCRPNQLQLYLLCYNHIFFNIYMYAPQMSHVNYFMCTCKTTISVYIPHEHTVMNGVTRSTDIHAFHMIDTCIGTYMHPTLYIQDDA